jgi:hypothetical protein
MQIIMSRCALVALERPVCVIDRMFRHPIGYADLALDQALLKRDVAQRAVGYNFLNADARNAVEYVAKNSDQSNEHHAQSSSGA